MFVFTRFISIIHGLIEYLTLKVCLSIFNYFMSAKSITSKKVGRHIRILANFLVDIITNINYTNNAYKMNYKKQKLLNKKISTDKCFV